MTELKMRLTTLSAGIYADTKRELRRMGGEVAERELKVLELPEVASMEEAVAELMKRWYSQQAGYILAIME